MRSNNIKYEVTLILFAHVEGQNLVSVVEIGAEVNLVAGSGHAHDLVLEEQSVLNFHLVRDKDLTF